MVVRLPRLLREASASRNDASAFEASGPRPLREPAPIVQWPGTRKPAGEEPTRKASRSEAQIRTKRFPGMTGAEEERYSVSVETRAKSPSALLYELARMLERDEEANREAPQDEPFILDVRLIAS
jgi:hypothetical protein